MLVLRVPSLLELTVVEAETCQVGAVLGGEAQTCSSGKCSHLRYVHQGPLVHVLCVDEVEGGQLHTNLGISMEFITPRDTSPA